MDVATVAAGLTTLVNNFGSNVGPIVLTLAGFGVGYYALGWILREVKIRTKNHAGKAA